MTHNVTRIVPLFSVPSYIATFADGAGKRNQQPRSEEVGDALPRQIASFKRFLDGCPTLVKKAADMGLAMIKVVNEHSEGRGLHFDVRAGLRACFRGRGGDGAKDGCFGYWARCH